MLSDDLAERGLGDLIYGGVYVRPIPMLPTGLTEANGYRTLSLELARNVLREIATEVDAMSSG